MYKVQDICFEFGNHAEMDDGTKEMYYRSSSFVYYTEDGVALLKKKNVFDLFTFYNAFSLKKWGKYTKAERFALVLNSCGKFEIELFGHWKEDNQYRKEFIGRYFFESENIEKHVIALPKCPRSSSVAFSIKTIKDTYIESAYYAADIQEADVQDVTLAIVSIAKSSSESRKNNIRMNIERMRNAIYSDTQSKLPIEWCIIDESRNAKEENIDSQNIVFLDRLTAQDEFFDIKAISFSNKPTHVVFANHDDLFDAESFIRTYRFISILKESFSDLKILSHVLSKERANYLFFGVGERKNRLDVNTWFNIVEEEKIQDSENSGVFPYGYSCLPVDSVHGRFKELLHQNRTCDYKNLSTDQVVVLTGTHVYRDENAISSIKQNEKEIRVKLQEVLFGEQNQIDVTRHMYYRSNANIIRDENGDFRLPENNYFDFFTYFNAVSINKWFSYTNISKLQLVLEIAGDFDIELFGHFKNVAGYQKEWLGRYSYSSPFRKEIRLNYSKGCQSSVAAFGIFSRSDLVITKAYYEAMVDENEVRDPYIAMVTTTFKKESYVRKNIELLNSELFADERINKHFCWNIVDNGRTLCTEKTKINDWITIFPNKNVGGAGGFSRGMIESLRQERKPTHILLMDDDVVFSPESFKRLCSLLSLVKDEYTEHFISGAMLKMGQPNIQHEDTGKLIPKGYHEAAKPNLDLNLWNNVLENELLTSEAEHPYGAWWFCCIPVGIARLDNLPIPVFVRGDDVEYSLRNNAKFITMNGLCIWHEGFEGKFSAALEYYQVNRNELAVRAMHPELHDVDCIGHIKTIFWEEMYKFNYKGASLLLDAVEDYMKGPDFFKSLDGEKSMKDHRVLDNTLKPMTEEIRKQIDFESLYQDEPVSSIRKKIYDYSYNGQARITGFMYRNKVGVIPYGWGYFPGKQCLVDTIIAVNPPGNNYVVYKKDRKKFKELNSRFKSLMSEYDIRHNEIETLYQNSFVEMSSEHFWDEYLK